ANVLVSHQVPTRAEVVEHRSTAPDSVYLDQERYGQLPFRRRSVHSIEQGPPLHIAPDVGSTPDARGVTLRQLVDGGLRGMPLCRRPRAVAAIDNSPNGIPSNLVSFFDYSGIRWIGLAARTMAKGNGGY